MINYLFYLSCKILSSCHFNGFTINYSGMFRIIAEKGMKRYYDVFTKYETYKPASKLGSGLWLGVLGFGI